MSTKKMPTKEDALTNLCHFIDDLERQIGSLQVNLADLRKTVSDMEISHKQATNLLETSLKHLKQATVEFQTELSRVKSDYKTATDQCELQTKAIANYLATIERMAIDHAQEIERINDAHALQFKNH